MNNAVPRVSVVMPAYNAADTIGAALASVQVQSLGDLEIIVIDDASKDATAGMVAAAAAQDARIRLVRMPGNAGPGACRNRGFALASGDWIAVVDADDGLHPDRLHRLLAQGEAQDADIVSDNLLLVSAARPDGQPMLGPQDFPQNRSLTLLDFIQGCTPRLRDGRYVSYAYMHPVFRRDFLRSRKLRYEEACRNGEDFLLYLDCFLAGAHWVVTPDPLYRYTLRDGSLATHLSRQDQRRILDRTRSLAAASEPPLREAFRRYWRTLAPNYYYYSVKDALRSGNIGSALRLLASDSEALSITFGEAVRRIRQKTSPPSPQ